MFVRLIRKAGFFLLLPALLGACAAPPVAAPAQVSPTVAVSDSPINTQVALSPTLRVPPSITPEASPAQAQANVCSSISLGESLPIMTHDSQKDDSLLTPVDPQNGQPVCGYSALAFRNYFQYAFSPDQKTLAVTDEGTAPAPIPNCT